MSDLQKALMFSKFDEVQALLADGASWDVPDHQTKNAIGNMFRSGAYDMIQLLIDKDIIELDVFEYDNFNSTIFQRILDAQYSDASMLLWKASLGM